MNQQTLRTNICIGASALVLLLAGCITNETPDTAEAPVDDATPEIAYNEDLTFPWDATGRHVLEESFLHEGGKLNVRIQMEGAMVNFRIVSPSACSQNPALGSVSIGAYNNFGFSCGSVPAGQVDLAIEFNGIAEGRVIVFDVAPL